MVTTSDIANWSSILNSGENLTVSNDSDFSEPFAFWRHPFYLTLVYFLAYGIVFITGLVGNLFVVIAVVLNPRMRVTTNYFITSLAMADLLIIIFCLPATLINNVLYEWYFGNFLCKLSVWINATTVSSSVYTLVAVSADRYFAICHTMRYSTLEPRKTLLIIFPIWLISGALFFPYYIYFCEVTVFPNGIPVRACLPLFPSDKANRSFFMVANLFLAFILPLLAIMLCYMYIYCAVARRPVSAVDKNAHERERRVKIKVTHMMVTVVALFAASWLPFYVFFAYVMYDESVMALNWVQIMRAVLQWCTLANSCINPILYAYFSRKFRRAFQEILILPCRQRYQSLRNHRIMMMVRKRQVCHLKDQIIKSAIGPKHKDQPTDQKDFVASSDPHTMISNLRDPNSSVKRYDYRQLKLDSTTQNSSSESTKRSTKLAHLSKDCLATNYLISPTDKDDQGAIETTLLPQGTAKMSLTDRSPLRRVDERPLFPPKRRSIFASLFTINSAPSNTIGRKGSAVTPSAAVNGRKAHHKSMTALFHNNILSPNSCSFEKMQQKLAKHSLFFGSPDRTNAEVISISSLSSDDEGNDVPKTGIVAISMMTLPCLAVRTATLDLDDDFDELQQSPSFENNNNSTGKDHSTTDKRPRQHSPRYKLGCLYDDNVLEEETTEMLLSRVNSFSRRDDGTTSMIAVNIDETDPLESLHEVDIENEIIPTKKRSTTIC